MSPPAVADRIAHLEGSGVIKGYQAQIDWGVVGFAMTVVIEARLDRGIAQVDMTARIASEIPEVERVDVLTGSNDVQIRLRVRDQAHLNEVLFERLFTSFPEIERTVTHLVLVTFEAEGYADRVLTMLVEDVALDTPKDVR
jgi:DNA-binding Lrp family transcriptional regulator